MSPCIGGVPLLSLSASFVPAEERGKNSRNSEPDRRRRRGPPLVTGSVARRKWGIGTEPVGPHSKLLMLNVTLKIVSFLYSDSKNHL